MLLALHALHLLFIFSAVSHLGSRSFVRICDFDIKFLEFLSGKGGLETIRYLFRMVFDRVGRRYFHAFIFLSAV